jgi:TonB family protein
LKPWQALTISIAAHLLVLFGGSIHLPTDSPPAASISVTIKPVAIAETAKSPPPPKPAAARPAPEQPKKTDSKTNSPATADKTPAGEPSAPASTPPPREDKAAQLAEAAGSPDYPIEAMEKRLQGCTLASVLIDEKGKVSEVRILHSDHPGVFDASVEAAQRHARYLAATTDGRASAGRALAVAAFSLTPEHHRNCPHRYAAAAAHLNSLPTATVATDIAHLIPAATDPLVAPHAN